jgi:lipoprotein-anchoring transpeptidase ErfK/SrfK
VWSEKRADFYDEQALAYARLRRAVRGTEGAVTVRTRQEAQSALGKLDGAITRAKSLDLDTTGAQHSRSVLSGTLRSSSLPKQYRSVVASADGAANSLASSIQSRQDYVNVVLRSAGNHEDAVLAGIDREVSAATDQMGLLGLLTDRVKGYRTTLADLFAAAHKQPTAFGAAVKEWSVHQAVAQVAADYAKTIPDRMIVVSTENQSAQMYEKGRQVYSTPVTTGGPELPTDHGVFHIYLKLSPFTFHSPWPVGSPYYYPPTPVTYWMPFDGAQGLHDASWRTDFGPGSNFAPTDLGTGNYILGTHGCVNLPMDAATFVWNWAPVGTTVVVV